MVVEFTDERRAVAFEKYLKSDSGVFRSILAVRSRWPMTPIGIDL